MRKRTSLPRRAGLLSLVLAALVLSAVGALAASGPAAVNAEKRSDLVMIDAMAAHGDLSLPAVVFKHDKHTEALKAAQKDCSACHEPLKEGEQGSGYAFSYKNADSLKGEALKLMFHGTCIGCHADMRASAAKTGPQKAECRSCHAPRPEEDGRLDIGFDKAMHYRHVASKAIVYPGDAEKNCGACHHVYDGEAQKLVWGKNKEDSCRACHMLPEERAAKEASYALKRADDPAAPAPADENGELFKRPTLDTAGHRSCVNCHLAVTAKNQPDLKSGPATCAGCHSAEAQADLAAAAAPAGQAAEAAAGSAPVEAAAAPVAEALVIPRLERGQDDAVLMLPIAPEGQELKGMMQPVAFNHKFHESVAADCRSCHHKKIAACSSCHSLEGRAEGDFIPWAQAMHSTTSKRSCVGCHYQETQKPACVGCHTVVPERMSPASCAACHQAPVKGQSYFGQPEAVADPLPLLKADKEERKALAEATVALREQKKMPLVERDNIPEKAVIGILSNEYQPSELPHRKIVDSLVDKQKDSRLAAVFHQDKATLCQGCHHNSPLSEIPPKCAACHGVGADPLKGALPLKAAYHQQCMTCHQGMNQKPAATECADCHKTRTR